MDKEMPADGPMAIQNQTSAGKKSLVLNIALSNMRNELYEQPSM